MDGSKAHFCFALGKFQLHGIPLSENLLYLLDLLSIEPLVIVSSLQYQALKTSLSRLHHP